MTQDNPIIIYDTPHEQRRAELRRALISDDDHYGEKRERRRLSEEEREALNRELRAAMRGIYENDRRRSEASR